MKVEGQTTGILEEKLKLEAEVGTLKEQLEKRGNEVDFTLLSSHSKLHSLVFTFNLIPKLIFSLLLGTRRSWPSKGI